jgi:hypothetical protein
VNHKEPDHSNSSPSSSSLLVKVVDIASQDDSDNDVARSHANGADDEDRLSANAIDV